MGLEPTTSCMASEGVHPVLEEASLFAGGGQRTPGARLVSLWAKVFAAPAGY